jgi:ubiquitin-like 1-activating enzyme E1 A
MDRMRNASVLIITLRGIAVEVVKNIVLAGVGSITILDDQEVKGEDLGANYFVREEEVGLKVRPLLFSPV